MTGESGSVTEWKSDTLGKRHVDTHGEAVNVFKRYSGRLALSHFSVTGFKLTGENVMKKK